MQTKSESIVSAAAEKYQDGYDTEFTEVLTRVLELPRFASVVSADCCEVTYMFPDGSGITINSVLRTASVANTCFVDGRIESVFDGESVITYADNLYAVTYGYNSTAICYGDNSTAICYGDISTAHVHGLRSKAAAYGRRCAAICVDSGKEESCAVAGVHGNAICVGHGGRLRSVESGTLRWELGEHHDGDMLEVSVDKNGALPDVWYSLVGSMIERCY